MYTRSGKQFGRPSDFEGQQKSPGSAEDVSMRASNKEQRSASTPEIRSTSNSLSPYYTELGSPCRTTPFSPEPAKAYSPCPKRGQQRIKKFGAYSVYKSSPHHVLVMDGRGGGKLRFVSETEIQQGSGGAHRYQHLASKSLPGQSLVLTPEDFVRRARGSPPLNISRPAVAEVHQPYHGVPTQTGVDNRFVQDQFALRENTLCQQNTYQEQPVYASMQDVPTHPSSSWSSPPSESCAAEATYGSAMATPSSAITVPDLSEESTMALSNDSNRASLQCELPESIFHALEHDMKAYPSRDETEQLWRMGVQLGIGAGISTYRRFIGPSTANIPEGAAQQDLRLAALAAQDIKASREMIVDAVHSSGLDLHMLPEGGFPGANKMLGGPRMIDDGQMVKDPMPSMRPLYDATKPVAYTEGGKWIGGIDMTQLDGNARLAAQALRDHEMAEAEMGMDSMQ